MLAFLERADVREQIVALGVDPNEAAARVRALDAQVREIAGQLDQLPAGQSAIGIIVGAILLVFLILLLTDLLGLTNVFPSSIITSEQARRGNDPASPVFAGGARHALRAGRLRDAGSGGAARRCARSAGAGRGRGRAVPSAAGAVLRPGGARHGAGLVRLPARQEILAGGGVHARPRGHAQSRPGRRRAAPRPPCDARRDLPSLLGELAAGHPVMVLQNLGLDWYPQWHFAVAVGYDLSTNELALRSGEERRQLVSLDTFNRTWTRADHWALVVLPPDQLPATGAEAEMLSARAGSSARAPR